MGGESKNPAPKMIRLPERDVIMARLTTVNEVLYDQEKLHPRIADKAGAELAPGGIIMMLTLAFYDFHQEMRKGGALPAVIAASELWLNELMKDYIGALIDDEAAKQEALAFYGKTLHKA